MKAKHTPGPWKVETYFGPMFKIIRDIKSGETPEYRTEADARLIESAPDLLAALKQCLEDDAGDLTPETVHLAMQAIAKAEGKN